MEAITITVMLHERTPDPVRRMVRSLQRYQQDQAAAMSHGSSVFDEPLGPSELLLTYEDLLNYLRSQNAELPKLRLQTNTSAIWNALMRARNKMPLVVACEHCRRLMYRCSCPGFKPGTGTPTPAVTMKSLRHSLEWLGEHPEIQLDLGKQKRIQLRSWLDSIASED